MTYLCLHVAPGPVSALTAGPEFVSVLISWGAPQEPNGLIIAYEVTYRVDSGVVRTNTTDVGTTSLETSLLAPLTTVSNISVTAYTSVGPGEVTTHDSVVIPIIIISAAGGGTIFAIALLCVIVSVVCVTCRSRR